MDASPIRLAEPSLDTHPDPEWLELLNGRLVLRGARQALADRVGVAASTVTRIAQGTGASPALLFAISLELGIRPPCTVPLDDIQQRTLRVMSDLRRLLSAERVEAFVVALERRAAGLRHSVDHAFGEVRP